MRTRREQMQAYRFVIRRIVAAVLSGEPETLDRPMRRLGLSMFVSFMVMVLVFAGFGIYGLLRNPGGPLKDGELISTRGGVDAYVVIDGRLHRVPDLASARLLVGRPEDFRAVDPSSLVDVERGPNLGIVGAPSLPDPDHLLGLPWRVCSEPPATADDLPTTTVVIDHGLPGGSRLAGDETLYVTTGETDYLLWNDMRLRIPDPQAAVSALRLPPRPLPVGEPLINTVNAGPDLAPPDLPAAGEDSEREFGGEPSTIGDLFVESDDYYLLTTDGLARVGEVTARLLQAQGTDPRPISVAEVGTLADNPEADGFPQTLPQPHPSAGQRPTACTAYVGADEGAGQLGTVLEVFEAAPQELSFGAGALPVRQQGEEPVAVADQVVIAGGRGVLVQAVSHAGSAAAADTRYLVTDQGIRYPLATTPVNAQEALGYGEVEPVLVPEALLAMLPAGVELSQLAALRPLE